MRRHTLLALASRVCGVLGFGSTRGFCGGRLSGECVNLWRGWTRTDLVLVNPPFNASRVLEQRIRRALVDRGTVEGVIALPAQLPADLPLLIGRDDPLSTGTDHERLGLILPSRGVSSPILIDS
jgi:hypothetical protein